MSASFAISRRAAARTSTKIAKKSAPLPGKPRRTTVTLSPRATAIAGQLMMAAGITLSDAVSSLIERAEPAPSRLKKVDGLLVLSDPPKDGTPLVALTSRDIERIEERLDREYAENWIKPRMARKSKRKTGAAK